MKKILKDFIMNYKLLLYLALSPLLLMSAAYCNQNAIIKIDGFVGQPSTKVCWLMKRFKESQTLTKNILLLYGPPGNGKTTLARKIAEQTDSKFIDQSASTIVESYIGTGAKKMADLFEYANVLTQDNQKVVIFIDEIDALASNVTTEFRAEHKLTLQQLWIELDKCKHNDKILIIFATNHFLTLDKTFLDRMGGNTLEIKNPDAQKRKDVLRFYFAKNQMPISDASLEMLVKKTDTLSVRCLEDLANDIYMTSEISNNGQATDKIITESLEQTKVKFKTSIAESEQDYEKKLHRVHTYIGIVGGILGIMSSYCYLSGIAKNIPHWA